VETIIVEKINWIVAQLKDVYLSAYFKWLTEKVSGTSSFGLLSISCGITFALLVYVWFRSRET
jgi:hypothetical protein